jgi:hypothetical protein
MNTNVTRGFDNMFQLCYCPPKYDRGDFSYEKLFEKECSITYGDGVMLRKKTLALIGCIIAVLVLFTGCSTYEETNIVAPYVPAPPPIKYTGEDVSNEECKSPYLYDTSYEYIPVTPIEPSFEVVYEIEVVSAFVTFVNPDAPPGRLLFSNGRIYMEEPARWSSTRELFFFPAGTIVSFMSYDGTMRLVSLHSRMRDGSSNLTTQMYWEGYEVRLPEIMYGIMTDSVIGALGYFLIDIRVLLPDVDTFPPTHLRFEIGNTTYTHNGVYHELETPPFIDEETNLLKVPVLIALDALGYFWEIVHVYDNKYFALVVNNEGSFSIFDIGFPLGVDTVTYVGDCLFAVVHNNTVMWLGYARRTGNFIDIWASAEDAALWHELMYP